MNWKYKSLILGSTMAVGLCPTMSLLSSCSSAFDKLVKAINNDVGNEFKWICQHYRKTFWNREFCHELTKRIKKMGFTVVREWDEEKNCPLPGIDSKGKEHYNNSGDKTNYGYDLYFDIPSNCDDASYPKIILQAHTDMVSVVADDPSTKKPYPYDWSQGVQTVVEDGWMHSKDWKTTLGADDGAGVATILALAKHANEFKHGLIRCVFTVDEEDGDSGAKFLPLEWFDGIDYYLSLDGEKTHINWSYSAGAYQTYGLIQNTSAIPELTQGVEYRISITGLPGGHSGLDIMKNRMNPLILMGEVISDLEKRGIFNAGSLRLTYCHDNDDAKAAPNCGSIPKSVYFQIQGDNPTKQKDDIEKFINERIEQAKTEPFQKSEENKPLVKVEQVSLTPTTVGISGAKTIALANMLNDYEKNHIYGYTTEAEKPQFAEVGSSIGAIRIGRKDEVNIPTATRDTDLYLEFFGRSTNLDKLDKFGTTIYPEATKALWNDGTNPLVDKFYNKPWVYDPDNKMQKLIHAASDHYKNELNDEPVFGWLEISEAFAKRPDIHYGVIGPQILDVHTPQERIELSSIPTMVKLVLYILQNLESK